jgi:hypothetical protein
MAKKKQNTTYWIVAIVIIVILAIVLYYPKAPVEEVVEEEVPEEEVVDETIPVYDEAGDGYLWGIICDPEAKTLEFRVTNAGDFKLNLYHGEIPAVQPLMKVSVNGRTIKSEGICDKSVLEAGETATCSYEPTVLRIGDATYNQYGLNKLTAISVGARETETFKCE